MNLEDLIGELDEGIDLTFEKPTKDPLTFGILFLSKSIPVHVVPADAPRRLQKLRKIRRAIRNKQALYHTGAIEFPLSLVTQGIRADADDFTYHNSDVFETIEEVEAFFQQYGVSIEDLEILHRRYPQSKPGNQAEET